MTTIAILLLFIISALPFSSATEKKLEDKVINSRIGEELNIEAGQKKTGEIEGEEFILAPLPYKKSVYADFTSWSKATKTVDLSTNETLYEKNTDEKLGIASLTKLMTAIIVYENSKLDDVVTIPPLDIQPGESRMWLTTGDKVKISELLHGLLINSAGDASQSLAIHISGSEEKFVELMNKRAKEMNLKSTHFSNASGIVDTDNYSSANDMINLTRLFIGNEYLKSIVSRQSYQAKSETGKMYNLQSTNKLLDNNRVFGVKTGYTPEAGECLITLSEQEGHEILTIVLGSTARFPETDRLINWAYQNFGW